MAVTIKTSTMKYKNEQGEYIDINGVDSSFIDDATTTDRRHAWSAKRTQDEFNSFQQKLDLKLDASQRGAENGIASLVNGLVPQGQLPSYVDDVLEYVNYQNFPQPGQSPAPEKGKIYVDLSTNKSYRWGGTEYICIASDLKLGEASTDAYRGDRGKAAYNHATAKGNQYASGFYKIQTNAEGHVTGATPVVESDLTGLGVADTTETDQKLALKADRVNSAVNGNFAGLDTNGNLTDSGHKHADYMLANQLDDTAGDGDTDKVWSANKTKTYADTELSKKTDKVTTAVESNFAGFDSTGNLKDSGHKHADYMLAEQLDDNAGEGATGKVWSADKTKHYVDEAFTVNDAMLYKGVVNANSDLPSNHKQGWTYKVGTAGLYAGKKCEVGDMIICNTDGTSAVDSHWNVVQTNIDGAVTGPASVTANGNVALFDGTTGKVIKDGGTIQSLLIDDSTNVSDKVWSSGKTKQYVDGKIDDTAGTGDTDKAWSADKTKTYVDAKIDDTAGDGDTDKVWSADKLVDEFDSKAPKADPVFTGSISLGRTGDIGENSIAIGTSVSARGKNSAAFGSSTRAIGSNQFVFGSGNVPDTTPEWDSATQYHVKDRVHYGDYYWKALRDNINSTPGHASVDWTMTSDNNYVEIVGVGVSSFRMTGRKLDWDGNEYLLGKLYINADGYGATGGKEVAVKDNPEFTGAITLGNTTLTEAALQNLLSLTSANGVSF